MNAQIISLSEEESDEVSITYHLGYEEKELHFMIKEF